MRVARRRTVSTDQRFPGDRLLGVLDTSPFRIAIVYSIVFACGAAVLLGAVDFAVSQVVDGSTGRTTLSFNDGTTLQVGAGSKVKLVKPGSPRSVVPLVHGRSNS